MMSRSSAVSGLALTRDGALLIAAQGDGVSFYNARWPRCGEALLGHIRDGGRDAIYLALAADDTMLFVSDERSHTIGVIDLAKARASGFTQEALIGSISVGMWPVGLAVSPDGNTLFATCQSISPQLLPHLSMGEYSEDKALGDLGALLAIDVQRARTNPPQALIAGVVAGRRPVRVTLSPAGERVYVSARGSNAVLVFDAAGVVRKAANPLLATIKVGPSPIGIVADANRLFVACSDRFSNQRFLRRQRIFVLDVLKIGTDPVLGSIKVGAYPREIHKTVNGKTLLVTNVLSKSLMLIDLAA